MIDIILVYWLIITIKLLYAPFFNLFFIIYICKYRFSRTSSFVGEFLIVLGVFKYNTAVAFLASLSLIFGADMPYGCITGYFLVH